jgi:hypothetical protein
MATRIQAKINAPYKEKRSVPSVSEEHIEQTPQIALPPQRQLVLVQRKSFLELSSGLAPLSSRSIESHTGLPMGMAGAQLDLNSNRSRNRARSHDSENSWTFMDFTRLGSQASSSPAKRKGAKRLKIDSADGRSHPSSPQHKSLDLVDLRSVQEFNHHVEVGTSTDILTPDVRDNDIDVDGGESSSSVF